MKLIVDFIPQTGCKVQVDCATGWASLTTGKDETLKKFNITIDMGRHHNKNKNPVSDNACREFHKEVLKIKPDAGKLSEVERILATSNMNKRIRHFGSSSKEICFQRDMINNQQKLIDDKSLAKDIIDKRNEKHPKPNQPEEVDDIEVGHNVLIKSERSKLSARKPYRVIDLFEKNGEKYATLQKHDSQFRAKQYKLKISELLLLPNQKLEQATDDLEKTLQPLPTNDIEDEFTKVNNLSFKLFNIIANQIEKLEDVYRPSRDYKRFIQQLEEDDEDILMGTNQDEDEDYQHHEDEEHDDENEDSEESRSTASTLTPTSATSTSNVYTSDESLPPTPTNSPVHARSRIPRLSPSKLSTALSRTIDELNRFNQEHPYPPPSNNPRACKFTGSYNYNMKRMPRRETQEKQEARGRK